MRVHEVLPRVATVLQQVNDSRTGQAGRNEDGEKLRQSDGGRGLQNVQVLQNVRDGHKAKRTQESEP